MWKNPPDAATRPDAPARGRRRRAARPALIIRSAAALAGATAWLAGVRLSRFVTAGPSMAPALLDGDRLLVLRAPPWLVPPRPGAVVIARPRALGGREVVKRIARIEPAGGAIVLAGDNPDWSTDSRHFGPVSPSEIAGRVLLRYWPDERKGRVR